jgi:hypothetical protein
MGEVLPGLVYGGGVDESTRATGLRIGIAVVGWRRVVWKKGLERLVAAGDSPAPGAAQMFPVPLTLLTWPA